MNRWWVALLIAFIAGIGVSLVERHFIAPPATAPGEPASSASLPRTTYDQNHNGDPSEDPGSELRSKGDISFNKGEYEDAKYYYRQALEKNRNDPETLYWIGRTYHAQGKYQEAIKNYESALEIKPNDPRSLAGLGYSYRGLENFEDAIYYHRRSVELQPDADVYFALGAAYWPTGNWPEVVEALKRALEINPNHEEVKSWLEIAESKL